MTSAWQCLRKHLAQGKAQKEEQCQAFFLARREEIPNERFRERLHAADKITNIEHARRNAVIRTPDGMAVEFCPPREVAV